MRKFNITVNGKAYQVEVEELGATEVQNPAVSAPAAPAQAPAVTQKPVPAAPAAKPVPALPADGAKLNAPLPGMILNLKVQNGSSVKKGQTVLVIEAMKMENDIASPQDGVITFAVAQGENVAQNQLLAVVK